MNPALIHPRGNIATVLPLLSSSQQRRYQDALKRRARGHLPQRFDARAGRDEARAYYEEKPAPHPDGYVCLEVTDADEDPVGMVVVPTAARDASYRTQQTPSHLTLPQGQRNLGQWPA